MTTPQAPAANGKHGAPSDNPLVQRYGALRRWVLWRLETKEDGKRTKGPMDMFEEPPAPTGRQFKTKTRFSGLTNGSPSETT